MPSLTNPVRIPRLLIGKVSGIRTPAALLTTLALAAVAGCSSAGVGSGGKASAEQQAVADVTVRMMHDLGTNNYTDVCKLAAPGSSVLASGIEGCVAQEQALMTSAGQQSGVDAFLTEASEVTVDASKVVINGDSATVPKTALLYQGKPVANFDGMTDANLIRRDGQ